MAVKKSVARFFQESKKRIKVIFVLLILIWTCSVAAFLVQPFPFHGIIPRNIDGLSGIFFSPLLHANFSHLINNTIGLITFAWMIAWRGVSYFVFCTVSIIILGGLGVWVFARASMHIGASGLVFGYFGFIVWRGFAEKRIGSLLLSAGVVFFYGGIIYGVLPSDPRISWEAHLFGLLAGVLTTGLVPRRFEREMIG